ncbi:response regulator transcription factor [Saccharothrix longispora]|uniref:DNA-binding response OmpR family regulator n=1 Tax=Saccharothrix longispora TaxID=33920 RepID=A0ABU1PTQ2_9PSEU|nr:response regulator transcription factor [Saccharothrix longispora]MDR6593499.1 DNA-binding response OmpR family regulator [Saccharothrix longispora]
MPRALVVEDDPAVQAALVHALRGLGHLTRAVGTAASALREVAAGTPDIVVFDLGLPDLDGVAALRMLRDVSDVPVLVATARGDEDSVVRSLNAGADDYIVKPFSGTHLEARVNALLRRSKPSSAQGAQEREDVIELGGLHVDLGRRQATLDGAALELSRREFDLLAYLAGHPDRVVGRRELFRAVWDHGTAADDRTIDVHTSWLRRKLGETAAAPRYLHTIRGVGYRFTAPG